MNNEKNEKLDGMIVECIIHKGISWKALHSRCFIYRIPGGFIARNIHPDKLSADCDAVYVCNRDEYLSHAELLMRTSLSFVDKPSSIKPSLSATYPEYYKDVSGLTEMDVYTVHQIFGIDDPSGCLQHASKKILLSGVRTGRKSRYKDIKEARDTLTRKLELMELNNDAR
ncbi:MAG: hypothetical protein IBX50_04115 [Marinospirillum sp.]|uniref:hypothetical protein n=1 Tax=Marinospirillum sp. TaxID=2183934 RepID=UPI0019E71650|nr:hypothetical protein [Marinospirillum sp.]MBE0505891.1 hypothetical protein [Marinospirillum sp.]